jgi:1-acyl-sn-glycerol-3-phosphate acyltransferase
MNIHFKSIARHVMSLFSFLFITVNLMFWLPVLILCTLIRLLLPFGVVKKTTFFVVKMIYRFAVIASAWWFKNVLKIRFDIEDEEQVLANLSMNDSPLIICNHQSWFDTFLLQTLISRDGPMVKFLIKRELLWVPVLGWVCLVLDFPRLNRMKDADSRSRDRKVTEQVSLKLGDEAGALLLFPEGTRFSSKKRQARQSPHENLLKPKQGGFNIILQATTHDPGKNTRLLDISIRYEPGDADCWRCMSGAVDLIHVKVTSTDTRQIADGAVWLEDCWREKDKWLSS